MASKKVWEVPQEVKDALDLMGQREAGSSHKQFSFYWTDDLEQAVRRGAADKMMPVSQFIRETLAARMLDGNYL